MNDEDIEKAVYNFCNKECIKIINGTIEPKYIDKVENFLDILKVTTIERSKFLKKEPQKIGAINFMNLIGKNFKGGLNERPSN